MSSTQDRIGKFLKEFATDVIEEVGKRVEEAAKAHYAQFQKDVDPEAPSDDPGPHDDPRQWPKAGCEWRYVTSSGEVRRCIEPMTDHATTNGGHTARHQDSRGLKWTAGHTNSVSPLLWQNLRAAVKLGDLSG